MHAGEKYYRIWAVWSSLREALSLWILILTTKDCNGRVNGLPTNIKDLIFLLEAHGQDYKLFIVDFVKSQLPQPERRSEMRDVK